MAIVTDSTSDIAPARAQRLGVTIVPLFVTFGNHTYRDQVDLSRAEFYRLLSEGELPATSQPSPAMFEEAFASSDDDVLCITVASHLSGTINSARIAARRFTHRRIEVFDSQTASGGLGLMVLLASQMRAQGADLDTIISALELQRRTQRLYACMPDLSHLQRTGRIGRAQAALGTLMRIVPVLGLENGEVVAKSQVRTFARAQEEMLDLALGGAADAASNRFVIMHSNAPDLAAAARARLLERLGATPAFLEIWEAGPVIATHGGPGAVGICVASP